MFAFWLSSAFAETWGQMIQGSGRWLSASPLGWPPVPFLVITVFWIRSLLTFTKPAWHNIARTMSQRSRRQTIPSLPPAEHSKESYCFPSSAIFMSEHRSKCLSISQHYLEDWRIYNMRDEVLMNVVFVLHHFLFFSGYLSETGGFCCFLFFF